MEVLIHNILVSPGPLYRVGERVVFPLRMNDLQILLLEPLEAPRTLYA